MPRPCKQRRICFMPSSRLFIPEGKGAQTPTITLTLDEFETLRLIDHEGMSQEECSASMNVARTTAQAIYGSARAKVAAALVDGLAIRIDGGDYVFCNENNSACPRCGKTCGQQDGCQCRHRRNNSMRIAVTYDNGEIFQHFGHSKYFKLYMVEGDVVKSTVVLSAMGSGHTGLANFLKTSMVDTLICGGIGGGAQQALNAADIKLYAGVSGDADAAVDALLKGTLRYVTEANCNHHHDHGEGHTCGGHDGCTCHC